MKYHYQSDVKAGDLWLPAMRRIYKGLPGVINIIFTVAVIAATIRLWEDSATLLRGILIFGCVLFPVIQPLAIYGRSVKQLENLPKDLELTFDDRGVHIDSEGKHEDLPWKRINNAIKQNNMIIVLSDDSHGYMLTNRVLGEEKEEFFEFLCRSIRGTGRQ